MSLQLNILKTYPKLKQFLWDEGVRTPNDTPAIVKIFSPRDFQHLHTWKLYTAILSEIHLYPVKHTLKGKTKIVIFGYGRFVYILLIFRRVTVAKLVDPLYWLGSSMVKVFWFSQRKLMIQLPLFSVLVGNHLHKCGIRRRTLVTGDSSYSSLAFRPLFTYCSPRSLSTWAENMVLILNTTSQFEVSERSCFSYCNGCSRC